MSNLKDIKRKIKSVQNTQKTTKAMKLVSTAKLKKAEESITKLVKEDFTIVSFIMSITFGSFFNVCIYRIPNKKSVVNPPSHCYNCNTRLKPLDLVPILSWTLLRGKCRYCGQKISPRYALVELLTGLLFVLVYGVYGPNLIIIYYFLLFIDKTGKVC